jgi:hypothetical protein
MFRMPALPPAQCLDNAPQLDPCSCFFFCCCCCCCVSSLQLLLHQLAPLPVSSFTAALQKPLLDSSALLDGSAVQVGTCHAAGCYLTCLGGRGSNSLVQLCW